MPMVRPNRTAPSMTIPVLGLDFVVGGAAVVDGEGRLKGAFTDGDLRRALGIADLDARVADHMTTDPVFVDPRLMAGEALRVMNERPRPITQIFVCEPEQLVGAVHLHDLLRAGVA